MCYQYPGILDGLIPVEQQSHEQCVGKCSMAELAKEGMIWSDTFIEATYREVLSKLHAKACFFSQGTQCGMQDGLQCRLAQSCNISEK